MQSPILNKLLATAVEANELFGKLHEQSCTSVGLPNSAGTPDTICIDCALSGMRIVLFVSQDQADFVTIGIGRKGAELLGPVRSLPVGALSSLVLLKIMEESFSPQPA